jgi:hypothetical protein
MPAVAAGAVVVVWHYSGIGDYILWQWDHPEAPRYLHFLNLYYRPLAAAFGAGIVLCVLGRLKWVEAILAVSLLFCAPVNAALNMNQTAEYTTAESWMNYGEKGMKETVEYISQVVRPGSMVAIRDDILYYLNTRKNIKGLKHQRLREVVTAKDLGLLEQFMASGVMEIVVMDRVSLLGLNEKNSAQGFALFGRYYYLDREIGSFKIYRPKRQMR